MAKLKDRLRVIERENPGVMEKDVFLLGEAWDRMVNTRGGRKELRPHVQATRDKQAGNQWIAQAAYHYRKTGKVPGEGEELLRKTGWKKVGGTQWWIR
jgi:hypothetical protein